MTETTVPLVVQNYLAQLDTALIGVADATAQDIRAGIAEELTGLDAATAAVRIEALGDPFFIAAAAREAGGEPESAEHNAAQPAAPHPSDARARVDSPGYIVFASLLVALGGAVVPVLGWIAGIVMVWASQTWTRREKRWATLLPIAAAVVVTGGAAAVFMAGMTGSAEYSPGTGSSPLFPAWFDIVWSSALVLTLVNFAVGLGLLLRAERRRRVASVPPPHAATPAREPRGD